MMGSYRPWSTLTEPPARPVPVACASLPRWLSGPISSAVRSTASRPEMRKLPASATRASSPAGVGATVCVTSQAAATPSTQYRRKKEGKRARRPSLVWYDAQTMGVKKRSAIIPGKRRVPLRTRNRASPNTTGHVMAKRTIA